MDAWLEQNLVCPRDFTALVIEGEALVCPTGHSYPYIDGVPVMLLAEERPTHAHCVESIRFAADRQQDRQKRSHHAVATPTTGGTIDPFVQQNVAATCGLMYRSAINRLSEYPIPSVPLPVGIDPAIEAVLAARRVAAQLGSPARYLVADARHLPFRPGAFDVVHSYSVFQHFAKDDVRHSLTEVGRVLKTGGKSVVQMPNKSGLRNLCVQLMRGFRDPADPSSFLTRYWSMREICQAFEAAVGPTTLTVDGYFYTSAGSGIARELPWRFRVLLELSVLLTKLSGTVSPLKFLADSVYAESERAAPAHAGMELESN